MQYSSIELKNIGKGLQSNRIPSDNLLNSLHSFDLLSRNKSNSRCFFSKVLVRNCFGLTSERVCRYLSEYFNVSRRDVNIIKESFVKNTFVCLIRFINFNHYIQYENSVL